MIPDFRMVNISAIFQEVWPFFIAMAAGVLFVCCCYCIHKRMANSCMDSFIRDRPVINGDAEGAMVPPDVGRSVNPISTRSRRAKSVNPISTRRADANHIITGAP